MSMVKVENVHDDIPYLLSSKIDQSTYAIEYDNPAIYAAVQNHINTKKDILRYHKQYYNQIGNIFVMLPSKK